MWMLLSFLLGCDPDPIGPDDSGDGEDTKDADFMPEELCQIDVQCDGGIIDDPKTPCTMSVADSMGEVMYSGPVAMELRGRSSLAFPKKQYAFELREYSELPLWP